MFVSDLPENHSRHCVCYSSSMANLDARRPRSDSMIKLLNSSTAQEPRTSLTIPAKKKVAFNSSQDRMRHPEMSSVEIPGANRNATNFYVFLYNPKLDENLEKSRRFRPKFGAPTFANSPRSASTEPRRSLAERMPGSHGDTAPNSRRPSVSYFTFRRRDTTTTTESTANPLRNDSITSSFRRGSQNATSDRKVSNDSGIALEKSPKQSRDETFQFQTEFTNTHV